MAATPGERKCLGVILIVELWDRLQGPAARNSRTLEAQIREAVERLHGKIPESYLPPHPRSAYWEWLDALGEDVTDVPFDISRLLTDPFPDIGIEMQSIPIPAVHEAQLLPVNENEYTIFIEDAESIGDGDPPLREDQVRGLDLEIQELVRAKKVRRVRAYRVVNRG